MSTKQHKYYLNNAKIKTNKTNKQTKTIIVQGNSTYHVHARALYTTHNPT